MKFIVLLCDGMADLPIEALGGKTPLEVAQKPNMDHIADKGRTGMLKTMVAGLPLDSSVANLAILGYDPKKYFPGRGPLEAARHGLKMDADDVALRFNLITAEDGMITDFTAGHISDDESRQLIKAVADKFATDEVQFHPGVSYRNILMLRKKFSADIECTPPHDVIGEKVSANLTKPLTPAASATSEMLNKIMLESVALLSDHPVNTVRIKAGLNPANMAWFWGPGKKPDMPSFTKKYGIKGSLISAVDLLKGTASVIGLQSIDVPGATGYLDTNYKGKADYAIKSLEKNDFVFIHVESTDEAGHEGSAENKIKAIEDIDKQVLGRLLDGLDEEYALGLLPDHQTPVSTRMHTMEPVPFAIYKTQVAGDSVTKFTEKSCAKGYYKEKIGTQFMNLLLSD